MSKKTAKLIVFITNITVSFVLGGAYAVIGRRDLAINILFLLVGILLLVFLIKTLLDFFES
ncbi:MAG: hypothetical protein NZM26_00195 [Patescibacteria group bacterium]|nr:hypothetical protein [Patescibacteria group bacterium]